MDRWLNDIWYQPRGAAFLMLWPLSIVFRLLTWVRRRFYQAGLFRSYRLGATVIVVGNLTVGGAGKTPLVLWLVQALRDLGRRPGVISRGYGGKAGKGPLIVETAMRSRDCGDEPLMIRRRAGCPVVVGGDRVEAGRRLLDLGCDVIVADDGLQHLRLQRDLELVVVDGTRRFGNGGLIPAGPLREPVSRLDSVDAIIVNGEGQSDQGELTMTLAGTRFHRLIDDAVAVASDFAEPVNAVAGIGNPQRFFDALRDLGLEIVPRAFPDHHHFDSGSLEFGNDRATIMTEKDATRLENPMPGNAWFLPVDATFSETHDAQLRKIISQVLRSAATRST